MHRENEFFYIGSKTCDYRPFGDANTPVNWNAFSRWLARELDCEPEDISCGDLEFDGKELILVDGEIVGSFGGSLDRAPTAEEIEANWENA